MKIVALGVGEASDPALPNSSMLVEAQGFRVLIDCGHSVPSEIWRRLPDPDAIDVICFTHHHPDHCFGLVPLLIRFADSGRTRPLGIFSTSVGLDRLKRLCELGFAPPDALRSFAIAWNDLLSVRQIGPFGVEVAETSHAIANNAIRLEADGIRFAYSGDGRPTEAARALYRTSRLLFHECYVVEKDPDILIHSDLATVRGIEGPERIGIYHLRQDQRSLAIDAVAGDPTLFVMEPGDEIELRP